MSVNQELVGSVESPGDMEKMSLVSDLYIGGFPGGAEAAPYPLLTTSNFSGCIEEAFLGVDHVDLTKFIDAVNTREGCETQVIIKCVRQNVG